MDFEACKSFDLPIINTPGMFGKEVADMALGYLICLARNIVEVDRNVRKGDWSKPQGISLAGKKVALLGYGDIGRNTAKRLNALEMKTIAYDPYLNEDSLEEGSTLSIWPQRIEEADFLIITCSLNKSTFHLINSDVLSLMKRGVRIINVSRGPIINEIDLDEALISGTVQSAALDVFEIEPLPMNSNIRKNKQCILGSHNASNTKEGVLRTSKKAIKLIEEFLNN